MAHRKIFDRDHPDVSMDFAEAVVLAEARHGTLGSTGSYSPPRSPGPLQRRRRRAERHLQLLGVRPRARGRSRTPAGSRSTRSGSRTTSARRSIPLLAIGQIEGSVYMGLGEALMEEQVFPQRRSQDPVDARLQEPDVRGHAAGRVDPRGNVGSRGTVRRERVWSGTAVCRSSPRFRSPCTTRSAFVSTRARSRRTRS